MVYQRRYIRPFVGTTIVIQDDAITPDKLADKAVEEKHLGDDVVSQRALGTAAVASDEIKNGEVKTVDIGDAQVTEPKLADGAVTLDKLSFTPSTRPLTPGVDSTEILDEAVVESKYGDDSIPTAAYKPGSVDAAALAGDAVETVKVKDRNITGVKIATDTVDHDNIKADAVRGPEIQDGAVSENKLGTDAVVESKIKDDEISTNKLKTGAVTQIKIALLAVNAARLAADAVESSKLHPDALADRHIESLLSRRQILYDDFVGADLYSIWAVSGDVGLAYVLSNSSLNLDPNGAINDQVRLSFGGIGTFGASNLPKMIARVWDDGVATRIWWVGLFKDVNNYILFTYDSSVGPNWKAVCRKVGASTTIDTGIAVVANTPYKLKIDVTAVNQVTFYINDVEEAAIPTNIPTLALEPLVQAETLANDPFGIMLDKVLIEANEPNIAPP